MKLEEIHNCEKCKGKMVYILTDMFGITYCGYCHEKVDYSQVDTPNKEEFDKLIGKK